MWAIRQLVGMVFQNPDNQIVATTVEEDVAFGPENLGLSPDEIGRRVDEALALVGMEEHRHRATHLYRRGQKQRVAIAGVIAMRPSCIVLDEPASMLDPVRTPGGAGDNPAAQPSEGSPWSWSPISWKRRSLAERCSSWPKEPRLVRTSGGYLPVRSKCGSSGWMSQILQLAWELRRSGIPVPQEIFSINELVDYLCQYVNDLVHIYQAGTPWPRRP